MIMDGRYHGMELDPAECPMSGAARDPSAASLSAWALMGIEAISDAMMMATFMSATR